MTIDLEQNIRERAYAKLNLVLHVGPPREDGRPFDSRWKFQRVSVERGGRSLSYLKGAAEVLIERSVLDARGRARWLQAVERTAGLGNLRSESQAAGVVR